MQVISPGTGCMGNGVRESQYSGEGAIGESHRSLTHDRAPPLRAAPDVRGSATSRSSTSTRCRSIWVSLVKISG